MKMQGTGCNGDQSIKRVLFSMTDGCDKECLIWGYLKRSKIIFKLKLTWTLELKLKLINDRDRNNLLDSNNISIIRGTQS